MERIVIFKSLEERGIEIGAENVRAKKIGSQVGEHGTWERCTVDRMIQE